MSLWCHDACTPSGQVPCDALRLIMDPRASSIGDEPPWGRDRRLCAVANVVIPQAFTASSAMQGLLMEV